MAEANMQEVNKHGAFLVLGGAFVQNFKQSNRQAQMLLFERAKILKRRYPKLQIFGFQHSSSIFCVSTQSRMIKTILEDYITFPILLTDREFPEVADKACWLLFDGSKDYLHFASDTEAKVIAEGIEKLLPSLNSGHEDMKEMEKRDVEVSMGNHAFSVLKHSVLYFPGCIHADESSNRLFISDTNHHRIIVMNMDGKIVDYIGSAPGFEDGGFETAELLRPAGLFYDVNEDCLYFADSENHAIRRADMERRVVETVYPACRYKTKGLWDWILDKLGVRNEEDREPVAFDIDSFNFPWHVMNYGPDELTIFNRSFNSSWVLSTESGKIQSVSPGPNILETNRERIKEKSERLRGALKKSNLPREYAESSLVVAPYTNLISSATETNTGILFCDAASQMVFRSENTSESVRSIKFSDFEVLGYPYWLYCPIEPFRVSDGRGRCIFACKQYFKILPGRCEIAASITIPDGVELAAPLQEECIIRQVRGSATSATVSETSESSQKVGVAQQWYDELDNLVFSRPGSEVDTRGEEAPSSSAKHQDDRSLCIQSAVDTSPGTSEVVISAVLYVRLKDGDATLSREEKKQDLASKLSKLYKLHGDDPSLNLLLKSVSDLRDLTFMRAVHLRVTLECADHPLDPVSREIISTNSNLELNVSL